MIYGAGHTNNQKMDGRTGGKIKLGATPKNMDQILGNAT